MCFGFLNVLSVSYAMFPSLSIGWTEIQYVLHVQSNYAKTDEHNPMLQIAMDSICIVIIAV